MRCFPSLQAEHLDPACLLQWLFFSSSSRFSNVLFHPYFPPLPSFSSAGDPWAAWQSGGGGDQSAESHPVPGSDEEADRLGCCHAPDHHYSRPEPLPGTGRWAKYITFSIFSYTLENQFHQSIWLKKKNLLKALEASMKDRKKDLEELLAHSIELQRQQQLLPEEKVLDSTLI